MTEPSQNEWFSRYTDLIHQFRWAIVVACLAVAAGAGFGGQYIEFKNDYRYFFSEENPQLAAFDALQKVYTKDDNILFVITPSSGDVFTSDVLAAVDELTETAWTLPFATRVDSITNFQHSRADGDDLTVEDLFDPNREYSAPQLQALSATAHAEPQLEGRLIAPDGRVTGVNVRLELPGASADEASKAAQAARGMVASLTEKYPNLDVRLTGFAMLSNAFFEASLQDMSTLVPMMYGLLLLTLLVFLRSVAATVVTLVVIALSAVTAMGVAGWLGIPITPPSSIAPTMIMTLAVADSVHILVVVLQRRQMGDDRGAALKESLRQNFIPVLLTSLTTAVGLLSMNFSEVPPFRDLGNVATIGVVAAFAYSVVLLPALVSIVPMGAPRGQFGFSGVSDRLGGFVVRHRRFLLTSSVGLVVATVALVPQNELDDDFVAYFDDSWAFRRDTDYTNENLTGIYNIEFSVAAADSGGVSDPGYLDLVSRFADWYRKQPGVGHVAAVSDTLKRLNKNLHGDAPTFYRTPDNRELAAQYLLLYELSLPYGLDLNNQINVDKSSTRVTVTAEDLTAVEMRRIAEAGEGWLRDNGPSYAHATASSPALMFAYVSERNIRGLLVGTLIALLIISGVMVVALRSLKFGLLSLLPNLVPALAAFGLWAIVDGRIDIGLSMVATVSLGIVVDDSVHFLSKYLRARREEGLEPKAAVRYAFRTVGPALVVTSLVLVAGFGVLSTSAFGLNSGLGILTAFTLVVALVADLLFLPPLLMAVDGAPEPRVVQTPVDSVESFAG